MTKEEVEKWCEKNEYVLISLKDKISITKVKRIAEKSVNIANISNRKYKHRNIFARHLAVNYLIDKYPRKEIAIQLGVNDRDVHNSVGRITLNEDFKKSWRKEAARFFKNKMEEIELSL